MIIYVHLRTVVTKIQHCGTTIKPLTYLYQRVLFMTRKMLFLDRYFYNKGENLSNKLNYNFFFYSNI